MKASDLISFLQKMVEQHGDLPVAHGPIDGDGDEDFEEVSLVAVAGGADGEDTALVIGGEALHAVLKDSGAPQLGEIATDPG